MDTLKRERKGDGKDRQPSVLAREKGEKGNGVEKDRKQAPGSKTAHRQQRGLLFFPLSADCSLRRG